MRINKTTLKLLVVLISAIIVATVLFHVPITIVNAVTGQQAPEFGIHISVGNPPAAPFFPFSAKACHFSTSVFLESVCNFILTPHEG